MTLAFIVIFIVCFIVAICVICVALAISNNIKKQPKVGEWIPVEEVLPKEDGWYLVQYDKPLFGNMLIDMVGYDDRGFLGIRDVIAWQPLPKPYEV